MPGTPEQMEDLDRPATKRDLQAFATKADLEAFATKADLQALAARVDLLALEMATKSDVLELHRHIDVLIESFKAEFASLYDWSNARVSTLDTRMEHLETDHGRRLPGLETRVTRLEKRRK
jgi:hypothetical protein